MDLRPVAEDGGGGGGVTLTVPYCEVLFITPKSEGDYESGIVSDTGFGEDFVAFFVFIEKLKVS
jgi:hypothetical protein